MSSRRNQSPRELEWLSAYADGELPPQEADGLRARLEQDPGLRRALAEIRQTSRLLRSLPALKPPRAFTLSAERAAFARRYPRLQLATALAGLAFFLVVGADGFARAGAAPPHPARRRRARPQSEPSRPRRPPKRKPWLWNCRPRRRRAVRVTIRSLRPRLLKKAIALRLPSLRRSPPASLPRRGTRGE